MFFINDDQAEILEFDVTLKQFVGADHDVGLAILHRLEGFAGLAGGTESTEQLDLNRGF